MIIWRAKYFLNKSAGKESRNCLSRGGKTLDFFAYLSFSNFSFPNWSTASQRLLLKFYSTRCLLTRSSWRFTMRFCWTLSCRSTRWWLSTNSLHLVRIRFWLFLFIRLFSMALFSLHGLFELIFNLLIFWRLFFEKLSKQNELKGFRKMLIFLASKDPWRFPQSFYYALHDQLRAERCQSADDEPYCAHGLRIFHLIATPKALWH